MECDSNQGRYVIIEKVCQNNQIVDKPGCVSCRPCQAGDPPIAPVLGVDLAVNECTGGCGQNEGICSGLPDCDPNITPAVIRNCADSSFSCPSGYQPCKKEGAIWCYSNQDSGSSGGVNPSDNSSGGRSLSDGSQSPNPPPEPKRGGLGEYCIDLKREYNMFQGKCDSDLVCDPESGKCITIPNSKEKQILTEFVSQAQNVITDLGVEGNIIFVPNFGNVFVPME